MLFRQVVATILWKMQQKTVIWITRAFHTSPTWEIEVITGLIPIHFHLNKINRRQQLRTTSLPSNHTIISLLKDQYSKKIKLYQLFLKDLISKQYQKIKSSTVDSNTKLNNLFHTVNYKEKKIRNTYIWNLNKVFENSFSDPNTVVIIANISIKSNCATSISYVYQ